MAVVTIDARRRVEKESTKGERRRRRERKERVPDVHFRHSETYDVPFINLCAYVYIPPSSLG